MKKRDITVNVEEMAYGELTPAQRELCRKAQQATERSYAPYSHFCVGAAIELSDGCIVEGSNQENVAYPSGMCAERTAAYYAHSAHPSAAFRRIAIAARDGGPEAPFVENPISPCGACRQALLEYETLAKGEVEVLLCGREKVYRLPSIRSTLPLAFTEF